MDRGRDERTDADVWGEDADTPTEPDPTIAGVDAGARRVAGSSADPSGIDDPANVNAYDPRPGTGRGAGT